MCNKKLHKIPMKISSLLIMNRTEKNKLLALFETKSNYLYIWIKSLDSEAFEVAVCVKKQFVHSSSLERGAGEESTTAIIVCGPSRQRE
jgi:hypothetical protein